MLKVCKRSVDSGEQQHQNNLDLLTQEEELRF